ncbi:hypothetical protein [Pseudomonas akapageensis]|uniref:hypothetical protein n=1 Tax=Pseudomonas akapageensis TaxID=2609961 RepID=UPI0014085274|nr:hypothetical protein [Pseudomonas akapageensis]
MRIDGVSSHSYPVKRQPRKGRVLIDDAVEDLDGEYEVRTDPASVSSNAPRAQGSRIGTLPARQQDMIFPRARNSRVATALASYLTTASLGDWEMEVMGLDLYI